MVQKHRPRLSTRTQIIEALNTHEEPLSRAEIAELLGREKTPHLIQLIEQLVEEGILKRGLKTYRNGVNGYVYWLDERR